LYKLWAPKWPVWGVKLGLTSRLFCYTVTKKLSDC
jgi:hypothetical protein